jgi:hypothetical protein
MKVVNVQFDPNLLTCEQLRMIGYMCRTTFTYRQNFLRKHPPRKGESLSDYCKRWENFEKVEIISGAYDLYTEEQNLKNELELEKSYGTGFIKN